MTATATHSAAMAMRRARSGRNLPGRSASKVAGRPMSEMNVTPFIDVLLVLLIMVIMSVPVLTQQTSVNLPAPCENCAVNSEFNVVGISATDQLTWNGAPISRQKLRGSIAKAASAAFPA